MKFKHNNVLFRGTIKGVSEQGLLQILMENNIEKSFEIKEISFVI